MASSHFMMQHGQTNLQSLWKSVSERYDFFPGTAASNDERNIRLAKVGFRIAMALIMLMGAAEIGFLAFLISRVLL